MDYDLKFLLSAELDIENATDYYANISVRVLKSFNKRLDEALLKISISPFLQKKYEEVRFLALRNFPYIVLYEVDEEIKTIYILSVFCTHQNPEKYPETK